MKDSKKESNKTYEDIYKEIYTSYSYEGLSDEAKKEVNNIVNKFFEIANPTNEIINLKSIFAKAQAKTLFETQPSANTIPSSRKEILRIGEELVNETIFDDIFLPENQAKRDYFINEHYFILVHYLSRYYALQEKIDAAISLDHELVVCYKNICASATVISLLNQKSKDDIATLIKAIESKLKPPKISNWFGYFSDKDQQDSDYLIGLLRWLNAIRLCWLWDRLVIELYIAIAHAVFLISTIVLSHVSWSLYLLLASIHVTGILGAYYDAFSRKKELGINASEVRNAHIKLRKYDLINDAIWGLANLACCFWLCGFGLYANIGDLLTGLLLCMDLYVSIERYTEDKQEFDNDIKGYNEQLIILIKRINEKVTDQNLKEEEFNNYLQKNNFLLVQEKIKKLNNTVQDKQKSDLEIIFWKIQSIQKRKQNRIDIWQEKQLLLYSNIFYAAVLVVAFSAFCCFYLSFLPATLPLAVPLLGAMTLALSTLAWRSANSYIECNSLVKKIHNAKQEYEQLVNDFKQILKSEIDNSPVDSSIKKQLYLQILVKGAEVGYQEDKLLFKQLETFRETANRLIIPGAIVANFLFLPTSVVGVPTFVFLLLGILVATVAASVYIKKYYSPKSSKWTDGENNPSKKPCFIQADYDKFVEYLKHEDSSKVLKEIKKLRVTPENKSSFFQIKNTQDLQKITTITNPLTSGQ